jgi:hypothetical protein
MWSNILIIYLGIFDTGMGSVLELDCGYVDRNPQIDWSGLKKLDSETKLDSGAD